MIYYIVLSFLSISLISAGIAIYSRFKDLKEFRGDRMVETPIAKFLVNSVIPPKGSKVSLKYMDYLFVLNKVWTIRDFYFSKILCAIVGFLISLSIVGTNCYNNYMNCFKISKDVPVLITQSEYKTLSAKLEFDNSDSDLTQLDSNRLALSSESKEKLNSVSTYNCYKYVCSLHDSVIDSFGISSLILLLCFSVLSWFIPNGLISGLYKYLKGNSLFEYDNLETTISIMRTDKIEYILDALESSSLYYRNLFYSFSDLYEANPADAFAVIEQHHEFPSDFKRLIRYIEMLHDQGPEYVKNIITSNKEQTEQELFDTQLAITRKRLTRLKLLCTIAFVLVMIKVVASLFAGVLG